MTLNPEAKAQLQKIFTDGVVKLYAQGRSCRETASGLCLYRLVSGEQVLGCAIGNLIAEAKYKPDFEKNMVDYPPIRDALHESGYPNHLIEGDILRELQVHIHDTIPGGKTAERFRDALRGAAAGFARDYDLVMPDLNLAPGLLSILLRPLFRHQ